MIPADYYLNDELVVNHDADDHNAVREVTEQLGITSSCISKLQRLGVHPYVNHNAHVKIFFNIYTAELDLPADFRFKYDAKVT